MKSALEILARKFAKNFLYGFYNNHLGRKYYHNQIVSRSRLPLTEIHDLARHINMFLPYTSEIHKQNDWYGHAATFKNYLDLPQIYPFKFIIEHGFYVTDEVDGPEASLVFPSSITYSDIRSKALMKFRKNSFNIGPFIHYASHYLSPTELKSEKKRLGKTVLFFPSHSSSQVKIAYDVNKIIKKIRKIAKGYDSIRVCVYWKDVLNGLDNYYRKSGFECVTAGHVIDPSFLNRLKSIIYLSDFTISNHASTQLSYCTYMGKPHLVLPQETRFTSSKFLEKKINRHLGSDAYNELAGEFSSVTDKITRKQKILLNKYCGFEHVKTKKQFHNIVNITEEKYNNYIR